MPWSRTAPESVCMRASGLLGLSAAPVHTDFATAAANRNLWNRSYLGPTLPDCSRRHHAGGAAFRQTHCSERPHHRELASPGAAFDRARSQVHFALRRVRLRRSRALLVFRGVGEAGILGRSLLATSTEFGEHACSLTSKNPPKQQDIPPATPPPLPPPPAPTTTTNTCRDVTLKYWPTTTSTTTTTFSRRPLPLPSPPEAARPHARARLAAGAGRRAGAGGLACGRARARVRDARARGRGACAWAGGRRRAARARAGAPRESGVGVGAPFCGLGRFFQDPQRVYERPREALEGPRKVSKGACRTPRILHPPPAALHITRQSLASFVTTR